MDKGEILRMTHREVDRIKTLHMAIQKKITQEKAGKLLNISREQANRLCQKIKKGGDKAVLHGLRGKPSNNQLRKGLTEKAIAIIKEKYPDFGPTLAAEKLLLLDKIKISNETVRRLMIEENIWHSRKRRTQHRKWRERKDCFGEMLQMDGSSHDWFEGRRGKCVLLASIDDASNRVTLRFTEHEDTPELMKFTRAYVEKYGRPNSFYVDRDSIYITNRQANLEEELRGDYAFTQFKRAVETDLGIKVINANSPQAKGRVERLFNTLQDRLVKELRLANISTIDEANLFLDKVYIAAHNQRFSVVPKKSINLHRPLNKTKAELDSIFSIQENRTISKDYTLSWKTRKLQIEKHQPFFLLPRTRVTVEERLTGELKVRYKSKYLHFKEIPKEKICQKQNELIKVKQNSNLKMNKKPTIPAPDHPWRIPRIIPSSVRPTHANKGKLDPIVKIRLENAFGGLINFV